MPEAVCPGDCDGDQTVRIGELVLGVAIASKRVPASRCPQLDTSRSGTVEIDVVIAGVRAALGGCAMLGSSPLTPHDRWPESS
jgi:hypothetical protein